MTSPKRSQHQRCCGDRASPRKGHSVSHGPLILAGPGGGGLKQGQNIVLPPGQAPLANLWLSMLRHSGVLKWSRKPELEIY